MSSDARVYEWSRIGHGSQARHDVVGQTPPEEMERIWIAELLISDRTSDKIRQRHQLDPREVKDAIVCVSPLSARLDADPERGLRYIVAVEIQDRRVLVVLYRASDSDPDIFYLGSAYPDPLA